MGESNRMYMDSSHCRNTGLARMANAVVFQGSDTPAKEKDPKSNNSINGFPIQMYVNGAWTGVYNFNHDKSCKKSLGFSQIDNFFRWEIRANSETSPGAFVKTWDPAVNTVEEMYDMILNDFEIAFDEDRYLEETDLLFDVTEFYDELGFAHDEEIVMGTYKDYSTLSLARFVQFCSESSDEEFRERLHEYCDLPHAMMYYIQVLTSGMIDNFAKNTMMNCYDGKKFWFAFYDMDSCLGLD